jgi:hypothetical protein
LHSWFLDPAIHHQAGQPTIGNDEPLFMNTDASWENRPDPATAIPSLTLVRDYDAPTST